MVGVRSNRVASHQDCRTEWGGGIMTTNQALVASAGASGTRRWRSPAPATPLCIAFWNSLPPLSATRTPGWQIGAVLHPALDVWAATHSPGRRCRRRAAPRASQARRPSGPTSEKRTGAAAPKPYVRAAPSKGAEALSRMAWLGHRGSSRGPWSSHGAMLWLREIEPVVGLPQLATVVYAGQFVAAVPQ